MSVHDERTLWAYASRELDLGTVLLLEEHLAQCPECRERLDVIRATRLSLREASLAKPAVEWSRVDSAVSSAVSQKMMSGQRGQAWRWVLGLGAMTALALLAWAVVPTLRGTPALDPVAPVRPEPVLTLVDQASEATRVSPAGEQFVSAGQALGSGDRLRTAKAGRALVKLPDQSRMRVGAASELLLERATTDEVVVKLARGQLVTQASHAPRRQFTVEAGGVSVRVVGTAFSVRSSDTEVEVAVGEGKVLVELERGQALMVEAGQRIRIERSRGKVRKGALLGRDRSDFNALGVAVAPPEPPSAPSVAKPVDVRDGPILSPAKHSTPEPPSSELPNDVESLFLHRAEEGLKGGVCERYLLGLEELAVSTEREERRELARILRARCFDERLLPLEAEREYQRYLRDFPTGRFADEAAQVFAQ